MTALPLTAAVTDVDVVAPGDGSAGPCCAPAGPPLLPAATAADLAAVFKALCDPTRVRVLAHVAASPEGTVCAFRPYLMMRTADGEFVPWVASQSDLLADDWVTV